MLIPVILLVALKALVTIFMLNEGVNRVPDVAEWILTIDPPRFFNQGVFGPLLLAASDTVSSVPVDTTDFTSYTVAALVDTSVPVDTTVPTSHTVATAVDTSVSDDTRILTIHNATPTVDASVPDDSTVLTTPIVATPLYKAVPVDTTVLSSHTTPLPLDMRTPLLQAKELAVYVAFEDYLPRWNPPKLSEPVFAMAVFYLTCLLSALSFTWWLLCRYEDIRISGPLRFSTPLSKTLAGLKIYVTPSFEQVITFKERDRAIAHANSLLEVLDKRNAEIEEARTTLGNAEFEVYRLSRDLSASMAKNKETETTLDEIKVELQTANSEAISLRQTAELAKQATVDVEDKIIILEVLNSNRCDMQKRHEVAIDNLKRFHAEEIKLTSSNFEKRIDYIKQKLDEERQASQLKKKELSQLSNNLVRLNNDLNLAAATRDGQESRMKELKDDLACKILEVLSVKQEQLLDNEKFAAKDIANEKLLQEINSLKGDILSYNDSLADKAKLNEDLSLDVQSLQKDLAASQESLAAKVREYEELSLEVKSLQKNISLFPEKIAASLNKNEQLSLQVTSLKKEVEKYKDKFLRKGETARKLAIELRPLENKLERVQAQLDKQLQLVNSQAESLTTARAEKEALEIELSLVQEAFKEFSESEAARFEAAQKHSEEVFQKQEDDHAKNLKEQLEMAKSKTAEEVKLIQAKLEEQLQLVKSHTESLTKVTSEKAAVEAEHATLQHNSAAYQASASQQMNELREVAESARADVASAMVGEYQQQPTVENESLRRELRSSQTEVSELKLVESQLRGQLAVPNADISSAMVVDSLSKDEETELESVRKELERTKSEVARLSTVDAANAQLQGQLSQANSQVARLAEVEAKNAQYQGKVAFYDIMSMRVGGLENTNTQLQSELAQANLRLIHLCNVEAAYTQLQGQVAQGNPQAPQSGNIDAANVQLQSQVAQLQEQLAQSQEQLAQTQSQASLSGSNAEAANAQLQAQLAQIQEQLAQASSEAARLGTVDAANAKLRKQLTQAKSDETFAVKRGHQALAQSQKNNAIVVKKLEQQLVDEQLKVAQIQISTASQVQSGDNSQLQSLLAEEQGKVAQLQKAAADSITKADAETLFTNKLAEYRTAADKELRQFREEAQKLVQQRVDAEKQLHEGTINKLEATIQKQVGTIKKLRSNLDEIDTRFNSMSLLNSDLDEEKKELEIQLSETTGRLQRAMEGGPASIADEDNAKLSRRLAIAEAAVDEKSAEVTILTGRLEEANKTASDWCQKLAEVQVKLARQIEANGDAAEEDVESVESDEDDEDDDANIDPQLRSTPYGERPIKRPRTARTLPIAPPALPMAQAFSVAPAFPLADAFPTADAYPAPDAFPLSFDFDMNFEAAHNNPFGYVEPSAEDGDGGGSSR